MKKALLISALVLTIVASMVSGTLAVYTRTLAPYSNDVVAKEFILVSEGTTNFSADVLIAPTESVNMVFTVSNNAAGVRSEVAMDLEITVDFGAAAGSTAIAPLTATITGGGATYALSGSLTNGVGVFTITDALGFAANETLTYTIAIQWPSTASDINYAGHAYGTNVEVTVTGTQA